MWAITGFYYPDCRTVTPKDDKMSAKLSCRSQVILTHSGVRSVVHAHKRYIPDLADQGVLYMHMGTWLRELCTDMSVDPYSLIVELAITALAECAYKNPP